MLVGDESDDLDALAAALVSLGQPDTARPEDLEPAEWPALVSAAAGESS